MTYWMNWFHVSFHIFVYFTLEIVLSSEGSGDDGVAAGVAPGVAAFLISQVVSDVVVITVLTANMVEECVPVSSFVDLGAACGAVHVEGQVVVVVGAEAVRIQVSKRVESVADR